MEHLEIGNELVVIVRDKGSAHISWGWVGKPDPTRFTESPFVSVEHVWDGSQWEYDPVPVDYTINDTWPGWWWIQIPPEQETV